MEITEAEYKGLIGINKRLLLLTDVIDEFRNNIKQLKVCAKLVSSERKAVKYTKIAMPSDSLNSVRWRYDDLAEILKKLISARKPEELNKSLAVLGSLRQKTAEELKALGDTLNPAAEGVKFLSSALEKLGDTVVKVKELKKHFAGDGN